MARDFPVRSAYLGSDLPEDSLRHQVLFFSENSATADHAALERARQLQVQGADAETIRRETGWFQRHGRWFYEVDDRGFNVRGGTGNPSGRSGRFFDSYTHPEVERGYPHLIEDLRLARETDRTRLGSYRGPNFQADDDEPTIGLRPGDYTRRLNIPLHELQHAIDDAENIINLPPGLTETDSEFEQRAYAAEQRRLYSPRQRREIPPVFRGLRTVGDQPPTPDPRFVPDRE